MEKKNTSILYDIVCTILGWIILIICIGFVGDKVNGKK
jgi:hypothetical protein